MRTYRKPFQPQHFQALGDIVEDIDVDHNLMFASSKHPSCTFYGGNGDPLCCGGFVPMWSGLGITWAFVSARLAHSPYRKDILANVKQWHKDMALVFKLRRLQSDVTTGFRKGRALVLLLGYKPESEMVDYGPKGETMTRYVWLAKEHL